MKMFNVLRSRWRNAMPRFFARVCWVCSLISGTALAANEAMQLAGIQPHQWWLDVAPYLIGVPAGMAFAAKFSQRYDSHGNPIDKSPLGSAASLVEENSNLKSQT